MKSSPDAPQAGRRLLPATPGGWRRRARAVLVAAVAAGSATAAAPAVAADAVTEWNAIARRAVVTACMAPRGNPLHETRVYATAHVAVHDALNAIKRRSHPYALDVRRPLPSASPDAAVAKAARDVLVTQLGQLPEPFATCGGRAAVAQVEARYEQALRAVPEGRSKVQGIRLGRAAAETMLALREGDGSDTRILDPDYPQGTRPGEYRFTPDGAQYALGPGWGRVRLFVLEHPAQFASPPPLPLTSRAYAVDFEEVKRLGGNGTTTPSARTEEQTEIARFWIESSPQAWNRIALAAVQTRGGDLWASARLFALLNLALADGYIANFHEKYDRHPAWRPITAIRLADQDGNPRTIADPTWTAIGPAPAIPEHESGHALEGGAGPPPPAGARALLDLQRDPSRRPDVQRARSRPSLLQELLPRRAGERPVADIRRLALPTRDPGRPPTWTQDRPVRRAARPDTGTLHRDELGRAGARRRLIVAGTGWTVSMISVLSMPWR